MCAHREWEKGFALRVALSTLLLLWGCGPERSSTNSDDASTTGFSQSDSAGILISVTTGEQAFSPVGWAIDTLPEFVLGTGSDPDEQFYRIAGVQGLPDKNLLVVAGGSQELRFFDSEGRLIQAAGGKGEGPGEFLEPALVRGVEADSLPIWDTGLRRLQLFSQDGLGSRTVPLTAWPRGAGGKPPVGTLRGRLLIQRLRVMTPSMFRTPGPSVDSVSFVWLDPGTGDTIHIFSRTFPFYFADPPNFYIIGLSIRPSAAVVEGGALITDGRIPEIWKYGLDGRPLQVFRVDTPDRRVSEEDLRTFVAAQVSPEHFEEFLSVNRAMPIPDFLPWFDELQVDELGWVWAGIYDPGRSRPKEWVVFDKDGRAHGKMSTPVGLDVQWIGRDRILGVWTDDLGVEYVYAYGLTRDLGLAEISTGTDGNW